MKVCTWSPDTCSCQIEYEWDETTDETHRPPHVFHSVVKNCGIHGKQGSQLFDRVREEVGRKSNAVALVLQANGVDRANFPSGFDGDDQFNAAMKSALASISFQFDPPNGNGKRVLHVKEGKLSKPQTGMQDVVFE